MKKLNILFVMLLLSATSLLAQIPNAINFQAIARDANGDVMANTTIMIQLTVLDGGAEGTQVYKEVRSQITNGYGSFSFQIGVNPYMSVGDFSAIDWANGEKYMKVDYDPTASLNFDLTLGTIAFATVPYAFAAGAVSYIDLTGVQEGDVLLYNAATGKFEPGQITNGDVEWSNILNKPNFATVATSGSYNDLSDLPSLNTANWDAAYSWGDHASAGYLTEYTETDNIFVNSPAFGVTSSNVTNWNTAYSWGNHANAGYLTEFTETDNIFVNSPAYGVTSSNITNWNTAFGWGNHAGMYRGATWVPTWTDITSKPSTLAGYGITNAMSTSHAANGITSTNISNWNSAYSWGNHAGLYRSNTWVPAWSQITSNPFSINSPLNNQLLIYNSSSSKWENWTPNFLTSEVDTIFWKQNNGNINMINHKGGIFVGNKVIDYPHNVPLYLWSDTVNIVNAMLYSKVNGSTTVIASMINMSRDTSAIGYGTGISYRLSNISNQILEYGFVGGVIEDNTIGQEDGGLVFAVRDNGNHRQQKMRLSSTGNLGIGTLTPKSRLQVSSGDVYIDNVGSGVIMKDSNGSCWRVTVNTSGEFQSTMIPCPENAKSENSMPAPDKVIIQKGNEE